jgi:hypothetical protein
MPFDFTRKQHDNMLIKLEEEKNQKRNLFSRPTIFLSAKQHHSEP